MSDVTAVVEKKAFDKEAFKREILNNIKYLFRKTPETASQQEIFQAVAYASKDMIIDEWLNSHKEYEKQDAKTVYYLSMEFLMGRALGNNLINHAAVKAGPVFLQVALPHTAILADGGLRLLGKFQVGDVVISAAGVSQFAHVHSPLHCDG